MAVNMLRMGVLAELLSKAAGAEQLMAASTAVELNLVQFGPSGLLSLLVMLLVVMVGIVFWLMRSRAQLSAEQSRLKRSLKDLQTRCLDLQSENERCLNLKAANSDEMSRLKTQNQYLEKRLNSTARELMAARAPGSALPHLVKHTVKTQSQATYSTVRGCANGRFDFLQKGEDGAWRED